MLPFRLAQSKTRKRIVTIAGELISHARSIEIKIINYAYQEVCRIKAMINKSVIKVDAKSLEGL